MASADQLAFTDVVIRLKEGFEDKDVGKILREFDPKATLNFDGRFATVKDLEANLRRLFEVVDQTYLDVAGIEEVDPDPERPFVRYKVDVAWVDKKDWLERSYKVQLGLSLIKRPREQDRLAIVGLTATTLKPQDRPPDDIDLPGEIEDMEPPRPSTADGDLFSIWY